VVLNISLLVYDVSPWLVFASWFSYALENQVVRIFICLLFYYRFCLRHSLPLHVSSLYL